MLNKRAGILSDAEMTTKFFRLVPLAWLAVALTAVDAQMVSSRSSAPESRPTAGPSPSRRALSGEAAAALSAGYSYQPPKPAAPAENEEADLRETDRPRNAIVRLPAYVVEGVRPPVFAERNLYTKENLQRLAMARYLSRFDTRGLNRWTLPGSYFSNEARAMTEYEAQERLRGMATMQEQAQIYRVGDDARARAAQEQSYSTYIRTNEPLNRLPSARDR